ncbi:hypothetical protein WN944_005869 [Citrus x changshan-huyou]|uniref:Uncharacterized protein n=1 Tax=Citrus x changshan-huyou TaxID=2935761 RepID=A0AAP0QT82_9ROSI
MDLNKINAIVLVLAMMRLNVTAKVQLENCWCCYKAVTFQVLYLVPIVLPLLMVIVSLNFLSQGFNILGQGSEIIFRLCNYVIQIGWVFAALLAIKILPR